MAEVTGAPTRADLEWYATPGPMTTLPADLGTLPTDAEGLRRLLPGLVIHGDLRWAYGIDAGPPMAEMNIRPAAAMLDVVLGRDAGPLATPRAPADRMVGVCRHFVTLHTALLRRQGIPARARCGFAAYFVAGEWIDHWVTEYWDAARERWVRADPQLDETLLSKFSIDLDPADLPAEAFLPGGDAWLCHRWGSCDAQRFGIGDLRGPWFVAGNVVRDLAALNKVEVLPWDVWGPLAEWIDKGPDDELVDALAVAATSGSLAEARAAYRSRPWIPVSGDARELVPVRES